MCQIFPQPFPKTSHSPKQNHVWCARRNERQNKPIYCLGMPCVRDVGMSIFRSNILQAIFTLSLHSIPVKPFLVVQIAPRSSTWWKNPLSGLHLIVPICKHETWITRRPPTSNWSTKNSWNFKVLWVGKIFYILPPYELYHLVWRYWQGSNFCSHFVEVAQKKRLEKSFQTERNNVNILRGSVHS